MIPFLHFGPVEVPTFGLMVACAMLIAFYVLRADMARRNLAPKDSSTAEMFVAVPSLVGIVGAKLYHVLETPRELFADPAGQLFSRYGLAWFGGLIAGLAAFVWLAKWKKIPLLEMFDAGSAAAALGYGIGRIGCLLAGDGDYGINTTLPWGVHMAKNALVPPTPPTALVQPTPIYELLFSLALFWLLWQLGRKSLPVGWLTGFYLVVSGIGRFLVEFVRINPKIYFHGTLSNAQVAAAASSIAGLMILALAQAKHVQWAPRLVAEPRS